MTVPVDVGIPFKLAKQTVISEFEKRYISRLLAQHDGNISAAARAAGIDRMSIHKMLHRLGLANPVATEAIQVVRPWRASGHPAALELLPEPTRITGDSWRANLPCARIRQRAQSPAPRAPCPRSSELLRVSLQLFGTNGASVSGHEDRKSFPGAMSMSQTVELSCSRHELPTAEDVFARARLDPRARRGRGSPARTMYIGGSANGSPSNIVACSASARCSSTRRWSVLNQLTPPSRTLDRDRHRTTATSRIPQLEGKSDHVFRQPRAAGIPAWRFYVALAMIRRWHSQRDRHDHTLPTTTSPRLASYIEHVCAARGVAAPGFCDTVVMLGAQPSEPDPELGYPRASAIRAVRESPGPPAGRLRREAAGRRGRSPDRRRRAVEHDGHPRLGRRAQGAGPRHRAPAARLPRLAGPA